MNPPSEHRPCWRATAVVLGVLLLAGCMPSAPFEDDAAGPPPAPASPTMTGRPQSFSSLDLPLNPLANKDQLLRAFQPGRRDPFGNIIEPKVMILPKPAEGEAGVVGSGGAGSGVAGPGIKDVVCDYRAIQVTGLIQGAGSSEAIVVNKATGETGTLRPGDRGGASLPLLPHGCRVQSIDVNAGYLVIAPIKKGPSFKRAL